MDDSDTGVLYIHISFHRSTTSGLLATACGDDSVRIFKEVSIIFSTALFSNDTVPSSQEISQEDPNQPLVSLVWQEAKVGSLL